jgi:cytochrome c oxidase cbb3-type subunit 3
MDRLHDVTRARRTWVAAATGAVVVLVVLTWLIWGAVMDGRLLRTDPGAIPQHPALMSYARDRGARVFQARCAACHGRDGRGDPTQGEPNLADNDWLYGAGDIADIETIIAHGIRAGAPRTLALAEMPAYAHARPSRTEPIPPLSPAEIRDMTEYVVWMSGRPADPAAVARAAPVFQTRGGCYDCHGRDGGGDGAIGAPRLTDAVWLYGGSREDIAHSLSEGRHGSSPAFAGRLTPVQVRETAVYVYGLSHPAKPGRSR